VAKIDRSTIDGVARLARLSLSEEEADRLSHELASILDYVELLQEVDTTGIGATSHPIPLQTPLRDDARIESLDPELAISNAPESLGTSFVVPRVIDAESEG
jgi:aspartyl-tRNA(Asn)/glutamyl-tRNA(Gln) amidotransferase subunit C